MDKQKSFIELAAEVILKSIESKKNEQKNDEHIIKFLEQWEHSIKIIIDEESNKYQVRSSNPNKVSWISVDRLKTIKELRTEILHKTRVSIIKAKDFVIKIIKYISKQIMSISTADKIKIIFEAVKLFIMLRAKTGLFFNLQKSE